MTSNDCPNVVKGLFAVSPGVCCRLAAGASAHQGATDQAPGGSEVGGL
jgi:hypothetical protein